MKRNILAVVAAALLPLCMLSSCSDNDNSDPKDDPTEVDDPTYNGLAWFRDCIVATDSLDNFVSLLHGAYLRPTEPKTISVVTDSEKSAADLFLSWVTPDGAGRVKESENGAISYTPVSEAGTEQGTITFTPSQKRGLFATVSFSDGVTFPEFDRIEFIEKPKMTPPDHHDDEDGCSIGDWIARPGGKGSAYVVREATSYQSGIAVCLFGNVQGDTAKDAFYLPKEPTAKLVQQIFSDNWALLSSLEPNYTPDRAFWINKTAKALFVTCWLYHIHLRTGDMGKNDFVTGGAKRGAWEVYSFTVADHNTRNID